MAMWREMPSGREEAIETLVDMDPQGNFFRAARVLVSFCLCLLKEILDDPLLGLKLFQI